MNYLEIVLQGYFNDNNREFLEKYFCREFKKAEKEQFFEAFEFFSGCFKVIKSWEKHLQDKVFERQRELHLMLNHAKNGTLSYDLKEGETIEQKRNEAIEYCEKELKDVRPDGIGSLSFTVHLHSLTNGLIAYNMPYNELLEIKLAILKAFNKTQTDIEPLPPQSIVKHKPELKIDQIALKYAYEGLQITRENGNEIAKEYGHNSGEKLFQRFTYFSSSANRKGKPNLCTPKKLGNKISLIESIIELLPTDKQERAKDEVSILKKIYEAEYQ
ncbi:hypothetical protein [Mongoliibacter ruber]|uniref:Uncharacterized protein n=1 Tax=Mongoliibacter ruber TaxID=1750599 RepID=A0A2T0WVY8_9BACT|nr:hypothetical protein [Mongoliibacter ruber]PRY90851.1 hypothetical protein CLW00_101526 [Mongoliibacter ruber]